MATQPLHRYTLEGYLELEDKLHYRSEFHDGVTLPSEAAPPNSCSAGVRLGRLFENAFPDCAVYDSSLNLYIASVNKSFDPDVTVVCGTANYPKPIASTTPLFSSKSLRPPTPAVNVPQPCTT